MLGKRLALLNTQLNYEEAKEIDSILSILSGKLIYRDFYWSYGPGGPYLLAILYKIFGTMDLTLFRMAVSLVATVTTFYSFLVARFYLSPIWAFWAVLLSSSGLVSREHSYGHSFAYLGMVASLYFLIKFIKMGRLGYRDLVLSGLFASLPLLFKPVIFGVGAVICGTFCLALSALVYQQGNRFPKYICTFLIPVLIINFPVYGYLFFKTPFESLYFSLYPVSSGGAVVFEKYSIKSLLPSFFYSPSVSWVADLNQFLNDNIRYWTVILTTLFGCIFINKKIGQGSPFKNYLPLAILILYGMLIEAETIIWPGRPITFYINMLPSYILLALFFNWASNFRFAVTAIYSISILMCGYYFFYPAIKYSLYYKNQGEPLELAFAENVIVPRYTKMGYHNIVKYIHQKTGANQAIVNVDYNSLPYLFSSRKNIFSEDFLTFARTSFSPYHKNTNAYSENFYKTVESKIIKKIENEKPAMILIPPEFINDDTRRTSLFIKYLLDNWEKGDVLNSKLERGPFDKTSLLVETYFPKKS